MVAPLADVAADAGAAPVAVEAAAAFAGAALTFAVSGTGATIDSATGVVTIATDQLLDGERITVTATNSGGSAQASFLATVRATPPVCTRPPALAGAPEGKGVIGTPLTLDPGAWEGVPAPELAIAWLLDGAAVEGAAGTSYTPVAADDGKRLSARVTATNAAGEASAETAARAIVHAAPTVVAPLADLGLFVGDAPAVVEAAAAFAGNALVFAVEGGGATVDAKGRVSVPATAAGSATVTVTATNSGGSARGLLRGDGVGQDRAAGPRPRPCPRRHRPDRRAGDRLCRQLERRPGAVHERGVAARRRRDRRRDGHELHAGRGRRRQGASRPG